MLRIMDQKRVLFRLAPTLRAVIGVRRGLVSICLCWLAFVWY
jgi:hypothetical protein